MAIRIHSVRCCCGKWYLFNYKDEHIDFHFSLTASPVRDICCKWRLNGERPSARWEAFKHGLLAVVLQRAQGCTLGKATLQTSRMAIPRDLLFPLVFLALLATCSFIHPAQAQQSLATSHSRCIKFAGHDEVESRFSQVVVKRSLTTGVRPVRQESVVDRSNSHLIA